MKNEFEDGGAAFPYVQGKDDYWTGMFLRDYFASGSVLADGEALAYACLIHNTTAPTVLQIFEAKAKLKYMEADAMMKERDL